MTTNLMENALRFLVDQRIETSSIAAIYNNGIGEYSIRAIPCKSARVSNDEFDLTVEGNALDFIVPYEDLTVDPRPGDRITANGKVYEVNAYPAGVAVGAIAWKWCEGCYEVARRIHTKCLGEIE